MHSRRGWNELIAEGLMFPHTVPPVGTSCIDYAGAIYVPGVSRGRYGKLAGQRSNSPLSEDTPAPDRLVKPKRNSTSPKSTGDNAVRTMTGITVDDDGAWSCTKTYRHVPGVHTLNPAQQNAGLARQTPKIQQHLGNAPPESRVCGEISPRRKRAPPS